MDQYILNMATEETRQAVEDDSASHLAKLLQVFGNEPYNQDKLKTYQQAWENHLTISIAWLNHLPPLTEEKTKEIDD